MSTVSKDDGNITNKTTKAKDVKASAFTLFLVGGIGLLVDLLFIFDLTPVKFTLSGKIISCGGMALLFLTMIIFGFHSLKSVKSIEWLASTEDALTEEIVHWYRENLTRELIDQGLFSPEEMSQPDELKYFKRNAKIIYLVSHKFMNLNREYLENIAEKIYQELFDEN